MIVGGTRSHRLMRKLTYLTGNVIKIGKPPLPKLIELSCSYKLCHVLGPHLPKTLITIVG